MVQDNIKNTFFRILAALVIILGISFNTGQAQDFEEWKKNYLQEFQEFQNEHDKEFYEMLQQDWGDFAGQ